MGTEKAILVRTQPGDFFFVDDPVWDDDVTKAECAYVLNTETETGFHACNKSALYDDLSGYTDKLQNEEALPEGKYIVTYYTFDGLDLCGNVEIGISKNDIIENVKNQKYVEGADYFLMSE